MTQPCVRLPLRSGISMRRKLCAVLPCNLGRGDAALSPCTPHAIGTDRHKAHHRQRNDPAFHPDQRRALDRPDIWSWAGIEPSISIQTHRRLNAFGGRNHRPHLEHVNVPQSSSTDGVRKIQSGEGSPRLFRIAGRYFDREFYPGKKYNSAPSLARHANKMGFFVNSLQGDKGYLIQV